MSRGDVIVDDHLLLRILIGDEPKGLRPRGAGVSTTGLWYHRLCRAIADQRVTGAMSRSLGDAGEPVGAAAVRATTALPESIGITSLGDLAWPMAELISSGVRLNLLSLEALAAAEHQGAEICLAGADDNPTLTAAAAARGVRVRSIGR